METTTVSPTSPQLRATQAATVAPEPQASVMPTPRSHGRMTSRSSPDCSIRWTLAPPGTALSTRRPTLIKSTEARFGANEPGPSRTMWGLPTDADIAWSIPSSPMTAGSSGPAPTGPISTQTVSVAGSSEDVAMAWRTPPGVATDT